MTRDKCRRSVDHGRCPGRGRLGVPSTLSKFDQTPAEPRAAAPRPGRVGGYTEFSSHEIEK
eukprot:2048655-Prymnesium_polylepis.1